VLEGIDATRARDAVEAIAVDLAAMASPLSGRLFDGHAGLALFFAYTGDTELTEGLLDRAVEAASELGPWLYGGFTGVAWLLDHVGASIEEGAAEEDSGDANQVIDDALDELLRVRPWHDHYDLVFGLAGYARYALDRPPRARGAALLDLALQRLGEVVEHGPDGAALRTRPALLGEQARSEMPEGYFGLGLAHGAAGVVAVLAEAVARASGGDAARPLLDDCVRWLRARRLPGVQGFPSLIAAKGRVDPPLRPGWCNGDPGVALALLRAANALGDEALRDEALALLRDVAGRAGDDGLLLDAALCHGYAGLGLLLVRAAEAAGGDDLLRDGARRAFGAALDLRRPGEGIGGFDRPDGAGGRVADPGLQTGAAGIGLALLAASTPTAPRWDRLFLLSGGTEP
jgi:lantibiotic modifying enzyme